MKSMITASAKWTKAFVSCLFVLLAFTACTLDSSLEETTLTLSEQGPISFTKDGGEKQITITTNSAETVAISSASWVETIVSGSELTLKVDVNPSPKDRKALISVLAGSAVTDFEVIQSGAEIMLVGMPEAITVDSWENTYTFDVETNVENWDAFCNESWVTVTALPAKKEIRVVVADNQPATPVITGEEQGGEEAKPTKERTARIVLKAEGSEQGTEITLTQEGSPFFILPYLDYKEGFRSLIRAFEEARRSEVEMNSSGWYDFTTLSPLFPNISYSVGRVTPMTGATAVLSSPTALTGETYDQFIDFLKANGFTVEQGDQQFFNPDNRAVATIFVRDWNPCVVYEFIPKQDRAYPTFTEMPYSLLDFGKAGREEIMAYESEHFGTYSPDPEYELPEEPIHYLFFRVDDPKRPWYGARGYYVQESTEAGKKVLIATDHEFKDINMIYWQNGKYTLLTDEFQSFMNAEGFEYKGRDSDRKRDTFINKEKGLQLQTRLVQYQGEPNPVATMLIGSYVATENSAYTLLDEIADKLPDTRHR